MARAEAERGQAAEGAGVYLHLPFCARICPYCDFSVALAGPGDRGRFLTALLAEIGQWEGRFPHLVDTIYFGGGTPSLIAPSDLRRLLAALRASLDVGPDAQIFLEANPEDVSSDRLSEWAEIGVSTLSLGVQSLDDEALRFLGRRHSAEQARQAVRDALGSAITTVSVDLIYGRPNQRVSDWEAELESVAELGPQHLSCYYLTLHPATPFGRLAARGGLEELEQRQQGELFEATHRSLKVLGWAAYEVSNFASAPRYRSLHNQKYWSGAPYLGLGPSAHSFDDGERWWNVAEHGEYVRRARAGEALIESREVLTREQRLLESVMLGLRTVAGLDVQGLERHFDLEFAALNRDLFASWEERGWARLVPGGIALLPPGLARADGLAAQVELPPGPIQ